VLEQACFLISCLFCRQQHIAGKSHLTKVSSDVVVTAGAAGMAAAIAAARQALKCFFEKHGAAEPLYGLIHTLGGLYDDSVTQSRASQELAERRSRLNAVRAARSARYGP
jgi:hypothetical protein